jgi:hypothetical protein
MRRPRLPISVLATLLLSTLPVGVAAQTVTGRLVDRSTGEPLQAAFVVLLDGGGVERGAFSRTPRDAMG